MKATALNNTRLGVVRLNHVRLNSVGVPSGKSGGSTPPEPEENAWLWSDGTPVLWGDGTTVLIEQNV